MQPLILHATTVCMNGRGVLITGASGKGKSSLALQLMAIGADLVSDDQTIVERRGNDLVASCPPAILGCIEARGFGLFKVPAQKTCTLSLVVDLDQEDRSRLPQERQFTLLGCHVDLAFGPVTAHFPAAIALCLRYGRATV